MEYDFDKLKNLYETDPDKFKEITDGMINNVIDNARDENKKILRAKQWRLEQELSKIKNPIERMNKMVSLFWEGVYQFIDVTKNLDAQIVQNTSIKTANVVDFKRKK